VLTTRRDASVSEVERYEPLNKRVVERVKSTIGVNPRTRVAGVNPETFSVDISTGDIYVSPVERDEIAEGYLTHENGHRAVFPASSAGSIAFISSVKAKAGNAPEEEVIAASNIVADVFTDFTLFKSGLGRELSKKVPDFVSKATPADLGMTLKLLIYKAIELASRNNKYTISQELLEKASDLLVKEKGADQRVIAEAKDLAWTLITETESTLRIFSPREIALCLMNPFTSTDAPWLGFLSEIAARLIESNRDLGLPPLSQGMGCSCGGGGGSATGSSVGRSGDKAGQPTTSGTGSSGKRSGEESKGEGGRGEERGSRGGSSGELEKSKGEGTEGVDIVPGQIDVTDVQKAVAIATASFGVYGPAVGTTIEAVFSKAIRDAVKRFLEKIKLVFATNDLKTYSPSGVQKKKSVLWLKPSGEPDEDSVLMEPHKLLWTVVYKVPHPRGRLAIAPAKAPEKLIIVQDESGSTMDSFGSTNVVSAEALVSMIVTAGLRYKNGAKEIEVIKFSTHRELVYSGTDEVQASVKLLLPAGISGGGTDIVRAVKYALGRASKNAALVVVTDAVIDLYEAEEVGQMLKNAVDSKAVGFVVFIVVNKEKVETINIIKKYLEGRNSIVEHISTPDDFIQVSNNIMRHILTVYSGA